MFKEVPSTVKFPDMEEEVLAFWKEQAIFHKSMKQREGSSSYVFYEGPPTANGLPGIHHVLARVFKDLFPRYRTMKGYYCWRQGGWDTHGLPVELEVEKELGFSGKEEIEQYGVAEFNAKCRESVFRYVREWETLTDRIGFWVDTEKAYVTLRNEYIESIWWILKQLWERDFLYQGYKVVPYCPRCGTPLSDHEVALGYRETDDPSIYVKFPLKDEPGTYFLVWTTTPWTLPGNVALAVKDDVDYVVVEHGAGEDTERLILARELMKDALGDPEHYRVVQEMKGIRLVGKRYLPLFTFLPVDRDYCYVIAADFVTTTEGTGIVHMAPAFGADDMVVGKEHNLPVLETVDEDGRFISQVTPWRGMFVKDADPLIIRHLQDRGIMHLVRTYTHTYPFCWRCNTPLLYYAKTSWFIETTRVRDRLLANNEKINWYPEHIKNGRFGNWLANNIDWSLGRERYWGTPLPVWQCGDCRHQECIGSVAELKEKVGRARADSLDTLDLHRPYVDEVQYPCPKCGGAMQRVPEVIDCWFDSGSMPIAQWHYPFENKDEFIANFPANYICEAVDQTRGWFYSLHAISTLLFDQPCYLNCVCLGLILDGEGQKMSKTRGNVVRPWDVLNAHGADALRWYLFTASPPGNERRFSVELVGEVVRKFLLTLWNTYSFFVTYANIDGFDPAQHTLPVAERSTLDRWILAELHRLVRQVDTSLANYDVTGATRPIAKFVDDLSNWYVRRSRRRFWKSEEDQDKVAAYLTLYECLVTVSKLVAPMMPFVAEVMYRNLVLSVAPDAAESVHLCDFPEPNLALIDDELIADTQTAMRMVSLGHAARNKAAIKVRQPVAQVLFQVRTEKEAAALHKLAAEIADELNTKQLGLIDEVSEVVAYEVTALPAVVGKKYGALFPKIRSSLAQADGYALVQRIKNGESVELEIEGEQVALLPEELNVKVLPREGFAVAEEAGYVVAVTTELTPALIEEGLARELIRRIQTMRKDAGFRIEDTIRVYYQAGSVIKDVIGSFGDYIKQETLAVELLAGAGPEGSYQQETSLEGELMRLALELHR